VPFVGFVVKIISDIFCLDTEGSYLQCQIINKLGYAAYVKTMETWLGVLRARSTYLYI